MSYNSLGEDLDIGRLQIRLKQQNHKSSSMEFDNDPPPQKPNMQRSLTSRNKDKQSFNICEFILLKQNMKLKMQRVQSSKSLRK